jgi:hypothetical protein
VSATLALTPELYVTSDMNELTHVEPSGAVRRLAAYIVFAYLSILSIRRGDLDEHRATTMQTAARSHWCNGYLARTPTREAIQTKHTSGCATLDSAFVRGRFVREMERGPARSPYAGQDPRGRAVIQHAVDGDVGRFVFRLSSDTRH